ncbi:PREDICTED: la-related protein 1B-like [Tarenaya hassleriana]|uniref:la-related protein 1B-like n=1 Tax=Tarenaya hassleriana TaxID=28532 RepID=UPI00053C6C7D|nr:PREDICTED: la-related protein 1B-like [Tarenaya hassleriana]
MAATASSASNSSSHTPRYSINSPMSRSRRAPSPWTQIDRGCDSDVIQNDPAPSILPSLADEDPSLPPVSPSVSPPIDKYTQHTDISGKKPAWNKPSNSSADVGPVMGAESWPALSVSARVSSVKSVSSESLKGLSDGSSSMPPLQAVEIPSTSTQKQSVGNTIADNHNALGQEKPFKRNNSSRSIISAPLNTIRSKDQTHSQRSGSYGGGNPQHKNSYRNRNGVSYPRGDSVHQQNHGNRRNYDHVNQTAFPRHNYNGRDVHMQQPQRGLGLVRPQVMMGPPSFPAGGSHYMAGPHLYSGPMLYPEYPSAIYMPHPPPESMALVGQFSPQPIYFPGYDPMLFTKIVKQVDFYFSADNLSKDKYLRQHMDEEGWVPVSLIAGFRKLAELTNNVQIILDAVISSAVVEVQGESIRRRGDWNKYVWPRDLRETTTASAARPDATLAGHLQEMKLAEGRNLQAEGERRDDSVEEEESNKELSASLTAAGT